MQKGNDFFVVLKVTYSSRQNCTARIIFSARRSFCSFGYVSLHDKIRKDRP